MSGIDARSGGPIAFANELRIRAEGGHEGARELEIMCGMAAEEIDALVAALEQISALSAGGPHVSAEVAAKACWSKLSEARFIARDIIGHKAPDATPGVEGDAGDSSVEGKG